MRYVSIVAPYTRPIPTADTLANCKNRFPRIKLRVLSRSDESVRNRTAYVSEKMQTRTTNRTRANELLLEYGITAIR